ncbi:MAG: hypothetical protein AAF416_05080 [Pseudomonadota bacterium]
MIRSRFSRFATERLAGMGHNGGPPLDGAVSWRRHCWKAAKKAIAPPAPLEIVRRRVARARQLGLAYPAYASILLGTGRDVRAMLFTAGALELSVAALLDRLVALDAAKADRLRELERCDRLILLRPEDPPEGVAEALLGQERIETAGVAPAPADDAAFGERRAAVSALLAMPGLPADTVVLIGTKPSERQTAEAGQLAKFIAADLYFATAP